MNFLSFGQGHWSHRTASLRSACRFITKNLFGIVWNRVGILTTMCLCFNDVFAASCLKIGILWGKIIMVESWKLEETGLQTVTSWDVVASPSKVFCQALSHFDKF